MLHLASRIITAIVAGMDETEKISWIRLARTAQVGPVTFYKLLERFGSARIAVEELQEFSRASGRKKPLVPVSLESVEREMEEVTKHGGVILCADEDEFSRRLREIEDVPPTLTCFGDITLLNKPSIGMVGARNASMNGRKFARQIAVMLGEHETVVVSGLARGIDTAAHEGAMATPSKTIAVVAGGADIIYPPQNKDLYNNIRFNGGLVVAEMPLEAQPRAQHFPRRNRIISGLSRGIVVVEASLKSGSLITARMAGEQGRDVFAVPGFPNDPRAQGPNKLIQDGAILVQTVDDILDNSLEHQISFGFEDNAYAEYRASMDDEVEPESLAKAVEEPPVAPQDDLHKILLSNLSSVAVSVDELARTCQLTIAVVQRTLVELELSERIQRLPGNRVCLLEEG